jgi:hypothetical protein
MPSAIATSPDGRVIPVSVGGMATDLGDEAGGSEEGARDERAPLFSPRSGPPRDFVV